MFTIYFIESEAAQLNLKSVIADDTPQSGIIMDTSIEHQIYKHIVDSKDKGQVAKVRLLLCKAGDACFYHDHRQYESDRSSFDL